VQAPEVSWALRNVNRAGAEVDHALAQRLRLRAIDYAALGHVMEQPGRLGPGELSTLLGISTGSGTELVDRLERAGHLLRHRHPQDRRRLVLDATDSATGQVLPSSRRCSERWTRSLPTSVSRKRESSPATCGPLRSACTSTRSRSPAKAPRRDRTGCCAACARRDLRAVARLAPGAPRRHPRRLAGVMEEAHRTSRCQLPRGCQRGLAFGWVDSMPAVSTTTVRGSTTRHAGAGSGWSRPNKRRIETLQATGLMTPAGSSWSTGRRPTELDAARRREDLVVPDDLAAALASVPSARRNWDDFPPLRPSRHSRVDPACTPTSNATAAHPLHRRAGRPRAARQPVAATTAPPARPRRTAARRGRRTPEQHTLTRTSHAVGVRRSGRAVVISHGCLFRIRTDRRAASDACHWLIAPASVRSLRR
jgi:hypothetical protein